MGLGICVAGSTYNCCSMSLMLFLDLISVTFPFVMSHLSLLLGVRGSKKIISFVIPFLFLLLHVALDCGLPFFEVSPPLFICHVILNHLQSRFLHFLFFFSICLAQLSVTTYLVIYYASALSWPSLALMYRISCLVASRIPTQ